MWHNDQLSGFGQSADVYCFAIILWQIIHQQLPPSLSDEQKKNVYLHSHRPTVTVLPNLPPRDALIDIMMQCWPTDPAKRLNFTVVYQRLTALRTEYFPDELGDVLKLEGLNGALLLANSTYICFVWLAFSFPSILFTPG